VLQGDISVGTLEPAARQEASAEAEPGGGQDEARARSGEGASTSGPALWGDNLQVHAFSFTPCACHCSAQH
jgi:hypothetical protein